MGPDTRRPTGCLVAEPWPTGPYGEPARAVIAQRLTGIHAWTDRYLELAATAVDRAGSDPW